MTRLELINRARVRIGDLPLDTESDAGADMHIATYESKRDELLSRYPWTFATALVKLNRLQEVPLIHWLYFYQLRSDMIGAPRAFYADAQSRSPFTDFERFENRIATNAEDLWCRHTKRAHPLTWPGYFTELFTVALMAEFALSGREDSSLHSRLREQVYGPEYMQGEGGLMGVARRNDSQGKPNRGVNAGANPLIDVRRGGYGVG